MAGDEEATFEHLASALVGAWPVGLALADDVGRILHVNAALAEVVDVDPAAMVHRRVDEVAPESPLVALVAAALTGSTPDAIDIERMGSAGLRRWEVSAHPIVVAGTSMIVIRGLDLTRRAAAEDRLRRSARHQALIADLGRRALQAETDDELLQHTASVVAEALLAPYAAVIELDREREVFVVRAGVGWKPGTEVPRAGQAAYTFDLGEAVCTGDVLSETRFKSNQIILDIGIRSAATAVVDGPGGTPWGILGVHSASVDAFSEEDIYVLSVIANVLGAALIRTHTEDTREAMRQLEREARERLEFLARSSDVLSQSLDVDQTMHGLAKLAIERFADWCAIELVDELGRSSSIVVAHADPSRVEMARELRERYPPNPAAETGPPAVVRSGRPELYRDVPLELLEATAQDAEHLRLLQSLGLRSAMIVPLVSRTRRVLGTASFVSSESERIFDADDLALATELGRRAGLAVENAQLFGERDYVARALQASLLPPARPVIHGLELSAIYRPAAAGPVIGGDFYDFFESDDGAWSIVIGDVCGKGADAAALTGLARHTIRAASMREASPAAVLADLNEVLLRDDTTQRFCTVALARLERHADGFSMISSCGGHPAPVVVRGDGRVEPTACQGSLIGILHEVELVDTTVELNPGDVVVLYTDGVTEARVRNEVFGEEGLLSLLAGFGPRHPDEVAAAIHEAVVLPDGGGTRDDVAIVVLRVSGVPAEAPGGPALDAPGVVAANA